MAMLKLEIDKEELMKALEGEITSYAKGRCEGILDGESGPLSALVDCELEKIARRALKNVKADLEKIMTAAILKNANNASVTVDW